MFLRKYLTPNVEFLDLHFKVKRFQVISFVVTFKKRNMKTNKDWKICGERKIEIQQVKGILAQARKGPPRRIQVIMEIRCRGCRP